MPIVLMFKAKKQTNRFNLNQKVWIVNNSPNHANIRFKYRGKGRYVNGILDKFVNNGTGPAEVIGPEGFKEIEVTEEFALRHNLEIIKPT